MNKKMQLDVQSIPTLHFKKQFVAYIFFLFYISPTHALYVKTLHKNTKIVN